MTGFRGNRRSNDIGLAVPFQCLPYRPDTPSVEGNPLGGGAVLGSLILGAIAAFIIDRRFDRAACYAFTGAVLWYFGFIHGTSLAVGASAPVALGYVLMGLCCWIAGAGRRQTRDIKDV